MRNRASCFAALSLAVLLLTISAQADEGFYDVDDHAAYAPAVEYVSEAGIMTGSAGCEFNPNGTVTRAQMAAIVCRVIEPDGEKPAGKAPFRDVPASYWAGGYIQKAVSLGIISGFGDGTFRPGNTLSFNQGVTMLVRAVGLKEEAENAGGYPSGYVATARKHHILNGVSAQRTLPLKRYEVAMMIYNYYEGDAGSAGEENHTPRNPLADGEYAMRISPEKIQIDRNGNETASAELLEAVVLDDSYVRSLKVGDRISLWKYGLDNELVVTNSIQDLDAENYPYINDYTYLHRYGGGWMIYENDLPVEYAADEVRLALSSDTAVIDGFTSLMETGELRERKLGSLREFFNQNPGERRVIVTIAGGTATELYIPYTPV